MEDNFRLVLIIIAAVVITAIFLHGLWTIRKNKNPYKLKAKENKSEPDLRNFDSSGFDQDGVSEARVVGANSLTGEIDNPPAEEEIAGQPAPAPQYNEDPIPADLKLKPTIAEEPALDNIDNLNFVADDPQEDDFSLTQTAGVNDALALPEDALPQEQEETPKKEEKPLYEAPVIQPKPEVKKTVARRKSPVKKKAQKDQLEMDFDKHEKPAVDPEVLVVSVVMPEGLVMQGAALLPSLLTLGMKYGDMSIFHRHQDNAGNGKVTFSLANMMNPGTFNLDNMENFATQGVSLFMTLPNAGDPFEVFEQMLHAAKQLAQEFNGQLLDDKRSVLTRQTEQHYVSKIREFERKNRISTA
ncbi:cell division protein ZipA [Thalassotalea agarivorans]|uniref:Cell division protein ZipA n=1 Tax=Thalassotalea agarivorans TaxID=349064 RepID=A0A1I0C0N5_THASX|nr:cell division protein ZipA [Thalassotalea agarivorans]SET12282.1 cell division protein ZipA [Thalassotalea agarivorans]